MTAKDNSEPVLVRAVISEQVATITLDSPANRNALSNSLISQLISALRAANSNDDVRVIVLTHTGTIFCSGMDVKESASGKPLPVLAMPSLLSTIWNCPKPIVARVTGGARGGGLGLIAAADIAICSQEATFAFSEVRIGVIPATISAVVIPQITPRAASDLMLTGRTFDGIEAQHIGLVTRAVAKSELDSMATKYLNDLLLSGPQAVMGAKELLRNAHSDLAVELQQTAKLSAQYFQSPEAAEGIAALREKRPPSWVTS